MCSTLENNVLAQLYQSSSPQSFSKLLTDLSQKNLSQGELAAALDSLIHAELVYKDNKKRFKLHKNTLLYEGTLTQHPKGFGFVSITKSASHNPKLKRDLFISPGQLGDALHGDTVLVRVLRIRTDERPEGSVVRILRPGRNRIGGLFTKHGRDQLVYPDDRRFPFIIRVTAAGDLLPKHGDGVIVQFARTPGPTDTLQGEIIEILGPADAVDTQMRLVIEQFNLPCHFSEEVTRETEMLEESFTPDQDREDLRSIVHVTIDGESAKDFDDAVAVIKTRKGYRLFVSIADVSYFVRPGSAIDREAYSRGTSVYFPGRVIPMLPEKLSNDLCSLVPGDDRFTVSAILDYDRSGKLLSKRFCRSVITSRHRFTYTTVREILVDKNPAARKAHKPFLTQLKWAEELATALRGRRKERGSVDFNLAEPEFTLTDSGHIKSVRRAERNLAHQIIEEFMLAANEAVAELFNRQTGPSIFRVHKAPEEMKAAEFFDFVKSLGLPLPPFANDPAWFAEVLDTCKNTRYEYIINNLLLRSMQQAGYSSKNVGHFGLAAGDYTHFTSPIRRYPDLIVHRELLKLLQDKRQQKQVRASQPSLEESAEFLSARERTAIMAERDMQDRLKTSYMKSRIGDSFDAIISGVTENSLYVEVQELCISGSIPVDLLDDDYYLYDKKKYRLFGEISAKTLQIGDLVRVTVVDVDFPAKRITFKLAANRAGSIDG
jgi:ribonuclease R